MDRKHFVGVTVVLVLLTILLMIRPASADVEFPTHPQVTVLSSDEGGITLRIDFPGFSHGAVQEGGQTFDILEIPGCGKLVEVGKPALPLYGTRVSIPQDKYFSEASVIDSTSFTYQGYNVWPAQEPAPDIIIENQPPFPTPPFTIDEQFYKTDAFYPSSLIQLDSAGRVRDEQVLPIWVIPFQFNPVSNELVYYSSITLRIVYSDEPPNIITSRADTSVLQSNGNTGCDFLIITDPSLSSAANTLATRRNAQGLNTLVVDTGTTGVTAESIKSYIQTAYDTWNPRPSYLLLLGDANLIPPFYQTVHPNACHDYPCGSKTGTDLYYTIMNGPESGPPYYSEYWTPDLAVGRIPVDTLDEANTVMGKIFEYEDHQWVSGEKSAAVSGYFQDDDLNGYEDRRFILTSEEIHDFLVGQGFTVDRLFAAPATVTPTNYNNGEYEAGAALPSDLLLPTFPWNADTNDITNAINDGRFMVFHRDHGGSKNRASSPVEGWGDPQFEASDVASLTNNGFYTIVYSINCETGWFDGETDDNPARNTECLCEALIRRDGGGAAGVMGATRISMSGWNDDLAKGFIDAIWPDFDPSHGGSQPITRMGDVLNYGKEYMTQFRSTSHPYTKLTFELFHYFGDPTMAFKIPIDNTPPTADPDGPYVVDENTPVIFDGSGSTDPDAGDSISLYEWDLDGDGIFETTGMNPTHTWCDDYTGTVTLRVTDTRGASATASTTVTVNNVAPTANAGDDQEVHEGDVVSFNGVATDPGCDALTYSWDFGDSSLPVTGTLTPTHAYGDNGVYMVSLTVSDDDGGVDTGTLLVTVDNVAPTVTKGVMGQPNPQFILPSIHTLTFHGTFSDPGWLDTHTATWDFGDGVSDPGTLTEEHGAPDATGTVTAVHAYGAPGDYLVTVTVTDDDGDATTSSAWTVHVADEAEAKHDVNRYIQALPDSAFKGNALQRKNAFDNMFQALDTKLEKKAYQGFIQDITNNIRSKADGLVDGKPGDDWITDKAAQQHICQKIDDIVGYVKTLM